MKMTQCSKGHFYDQEKSSRCPYCNQGSENFNRTVAMSSSNSYPDDDVSFTMPVNDDIGKTVAVLPGQSGSGTSDDTGKTVAVFAKRKKFNQDPVVGWLVITAGDNKGKDYKLHSDNNFVGRSSSMDVCIDNDETISRENHAIVSFDSKTQKFFLSPSVGRAIIRLNDIPIYNTAELKDYDIIELGETTLLFRSLCGEKFEW